MPAATTLGRKSTLLILPSTYNIKLLQRFLELQRYSNYAIYISSFQRQEDEWLVGTESYNSRDLENYKPSLQLKLVSNTAYQT